MKRSELKQLIREELKIQDGWVTPLTIKWQQGAAGIWHVIGFSENGKKKVIDIKLSDSMPNTMATANKLMLKFIDQMKKLGNK